MKRIIVYAAFMSLVFIADLYTPGPVEANIMCNWFGYCVYESPAFKITVVDKETVKPLADVHALVEWVQYGYHGRGGPLMVQDAVSGPDGVLEFPPWGPIRGSSAGLVLNQDPVITLFKRGYNTMLINNAPGRDEKARVRGFTQAGQTFQMEPFRGTSDEWVKQLLIPGFGLAIPGSEETRALFREPYLNRLRRLWAEKESLSKRHESFLYEVQRTIKAFEGVKR